MAISIKDYKDTFGVSYNGRHKTHIANGMAFYHQKQYISLFSPAALSDGYGIKNGDVYGGSVAYLAQQGYEEDENWTELTANNITEASSAGDGRTVSAIYGSTQYYLTGDLSVEITDFIEDTEFSGIIDGCGYTLTLIVNRQNFSPNSNHAWGTLIGSLTGTIKNIKINTTFSWQSTRQSDKHQAVGGVAGQLRNNATIENCYITTNVPSGQFAMSYTARPMGQEHVYKCVGGIAGRMGYTSGNAFEEPTVNIINTTVSINGRAWWNNSDGGSWSGRPDCAVCIGGFIGCQYAGTLTILNCALTGTEDLYSYQASGNSGGTTRLYKGGVLGKIGQNQGSGSNQPITNITNFKYSWSGLTNQQDGGYGLYHECSLIGHVYYSSDTNNFQISNIYYTSGSEAARNGWLVWSAGQGSTNNTYSIQTASKGPLYDSSLENYIGFHRINANSVSKLWVGDYTKLSQRIITLDTGKDIRGQFIYSITYQTKPDHSLEEGETFNSQTIIDPAGRSKLQRAAFNGVYIAVTDPGDITNQMNLQSISYAKCAYLTNEQGTTAGTIKLYYDNGSSLDYTQPANFFNERVSAAGGRINIYDVYKYEVVNNQLYFITRNTNTGYYPAINTNNEE